jgi:hypothetical protein
MSELNEAKEIIADLLKIAPSAICEDFHHGKSDRHEIDEDCPLLTRYMARIARARKFITDKPKP